MKIAICDDEQKFIKTLEEKILLHSPEHEISAYQNTNDFLQNIISGEYFDIVFLDIQMPSIDGWDLAKIIKNRNKDIFIVISTVHGDYIHDCFDRADWFAVKPITQEKVDKILDYISKKLEPSFIEITIDKMVVSLNLSEILFFEKKLNDIYIHTLKTTYKTRLSLKKLKETLSKQHNFVQTHKSYIINLDYYKLKRGYDIYLIDDSIIRLSRTYIKSFISKIEYYTKEI